METRSTLTQLPRDLGDGLILRTATELDIEPLVEFDARIHGEDGPDLRVGVAVRNLLQGRLPTCGPQDFTIVEDPRTGKIVSSLCLLSQIWSYGGITFPAGQPEFVGTDPEYRNRGLVRKQFDLIHDWARERGQMMLGITGIPYYYRLFGYEMAVDLDGWRAGFEVNVPALAGGSMEPYLVRPATEDDLPFIAACYDHGRRDLLLSTLRSAEEWRFELLGKDEDHVEYRVMRILTAPDGEPLGFFCHLPYLDTGMLLCQMCELKPGISWMAVIPTIIRALWQAGQEIEQRTQQKCTNFAFMLRENHPIYTVAEAQLPRRKDPYAWYLRVPDLKGFLKLITPVLEQRLANSICVGHSGDLVLCFYHSELCLRFEQGRLAAVEERQRDTDPSPGAAFTGLSFLQLLSGYRSLAELEYAAQDTWSRPAARVLLNILFPRQHSNMLPVL